MKQGSPQLYSLACLSSVITASYPWINWSPFFIHPSCVPWTSYSLLLMSQTLSYGTLDFLFNWGVICKFHLAKDKKTGRLTLAMTNRIKMYLSLFTTVSGNIIRYIRCIGHYHLILSIYWPIWSTQPHFKYLKTHIIGLFCTKEKKVFGNSSTRNPTKNTKSKIILEFIIERKSENEWNISVSLVCFR